MDVGRYLIPACKDVVCRAIRHVSGVNRIGIYLNRLLLQQGKIVPPFHGVRPRRFSEYSSDLKVLRDVCERFIPRRERIYLVDGRSLRRRRNQACSNGIDSSPVLGDRLRIEHRAVCTLESHGEGRNQFAVCDHQRRERGCYCIILRLRNTGNKCSAGQNKMICVGTVAVKTGKIGQPQQQRCILQRPICTGNAAADKACSINAKRLRINLRRVFHPEACQACAGH